MITVVGLGPGSEDALTLGAMNALKSGFKVYLRTEKHPTVEYIRKCGVDFETFDYVYEKSKTFDDVYSEIADELIKKHDKYKNIVYAVPGHPDVAEKSVEILKRVSREKNIECQIVPAVSFVDVIFERLGVDPIYGIKIIDAFDIEDEVMDKRMGTIITQVYNKFIASTVKLKLIDYYGDNSEIYFIRAAGVKGEESIRKIHVYELDRQNDIDYLTSVYVPCDLSCRNDFYDLCSIIKKLRSENGCPWDKEQTHESLKKYLIEECYEVLEAIDKKDEDMICEELGDVLLQVMLHSQIGAEDGYFNINDVIQGISDKMIERHPHVFGNEKLESIDDINKKWDEIKMQEQGLSTYSQTLRHVPKYFPALIRAQKIGKKASKAGMDFKDSDAAFKKIFEELNELNDVYKGNNVAKITDEIGDLLFSAVNFSRLEKIDAEEALQGSIEKFISRFEFVEKEAMKEGKNMKNETEAYLDKLWREAKDE